MLKRFFDISISFAVLILAMPILILVAIAIKMETHGNIIFRQERVTRDGRVFLIHKFRSMKVSAKESLLTLGDGDKRITKVGRFIRKFHIDELVQLIDVLKGDMSLVGPRPEVPKYTNYYKDKWKKVLQVRSGITGYGTLKTVDYEYEVLKKSKTPEQDYIKKILPKKLDLEIEYIEKQSMLLDLRIICRTVKRFLYNNLCN